jgi:hypothetical protein
MLEGLLISQLLGAEVGKEWTKIVAGFNHGRFENIGVEYWT